MRRFLAYGSLLLVSFGSLFSQRSNFTLYSIDEGIPQSQVHAICQDKKGYLWFGTDGGGISRYDGKRFTTLTMADGLPNDLVYVIARDTGDALWLGTAKGVALIKNGKCIPVPKMLQALNEHMIRSIKVGSDGKVFFGTNKGLFIFTSNDIFRIEAMDGKVVTGLHRLDKDRLLAGTSGEGLYELTLNGDAHNLTVHDGLPNNTVHAFLETEGKILVGTERGLCYWENKKIIPFPSPPFPSGAKAIVRDLVKSTSGGYYVVTLDCGTWFFNGSQWTRWGKNEGTGVDGAFCIMEDHEKNVWIGTDGSGAAKLGKRIFSSLGKEQGIEHEMILSILKTSKGQWWYGNQEGVTFYDGEKYRHFGKKEGLADEKVWSVTEAPDGDIWITTYGSGVFIYNGSSFRKLDEKSGLSSNNVRAVFHDSKKRTWIATANGLNLKEGNTIRKFYKNSGTGTDRFLRIYESRNGTIWVGTSGGGLLKVKEVDSLSFVRYSSAEGLADDVVLSITEDTDGRIWTGNFGGISCVDPYNNSVKKITRTDGLVSNTVYAVAFINDSMLLIGTNNGIDRIDIEEYHRTGKVTASHYGKEEGFKGVECNTASVWKDNDGSIWFGTINGLFRYDPTMDVQDPTPAILRLENIRLFFQETDLSAFGSIPAHESLPVHPVFSYDQNHLSFDLAALSYTKPGRIKYSYKLEGLDKNWSVPGTGTTATYSNLPHGTFTFMFKACNGDGVWNETPFSYTFTITPPFWKTWWFYTIVIVGSLLGIWIFIAYRLKRMKAIQLYLEKQVQLKTKELREEKELVEKQSKVIEKKNKDITSSIHYAKRIQDSILPNTKKLNELIPDSFIFFKPKDIVSGDFYWFTRQNGCTMVAAVDCTGHGVPGAFMSLIGNNLLNHIANDLRITDPKIILEKLHEGVVSSLKKNEVQSDTVDGMDVTLCVIHHKDHLLEFASTGRPLFVFQNGKLQKHKVGRQPVGLVTRKIPVFEKEEILLKSGDSFYLFTDGYCDQFGGEEEDKYMESRFGNFLSGLQNLDLNSQAGKLEAELNQWKGNLAQIDDVLVIGCRIS